MSLTNQIITTVIAVILGLAVSTLYILSDSSRNTLVTQLESHAEDGATHLGLYLAPYMQKGDVATVETAVNAIFDSGFYQRIDVLDRAGEALYSKQFDSSANIDAPEWFIQLIPITPPTKTRDIAYNWQQVGSIHIRSRAGYAYEQLWLGVRNALVLSAALSLLAALVLSGLLRILLSPLRGVEHQAMALARREYIEQPNLPKTRELRRVVTAMNLMVRQVENMFNEQNRNIEALRTAAYRDTLTGLNNRKAALTQLNEHLEYRQDFGPASLICLRLNNLQQLNKELGEDNTNHLIQTSARLLDELAKQLGFNVTGRMGGAELVLLARRRNRDLWQQKLEPLASQINTLHAQLNNTEGKPNIVSIGISSCEGHDKTETLLSQARFAADQAEESDEAIAFYSQHQAQRGWSEQWQEHVANVIGNGQIFLQQQTLVDTEHQPVHAEVFARILNQENEPCSAGEFLGVARDLDLLPVIDRLVIERALSYLLTHEAPSRLAVNLANQTLSQPEFVDWLLQKLEQSPASARLSIEVNETAILTRLYAIQSLRNSLQGLGVEFGVDNFGTHPNGFSYLYALRPDYLKIDGSLVRHLSHSEEDRFFVSSLISVAHSLEIQAHAEHVENETQRSTLQGMKIDGTQGYLHGQPSALGSVSEV